jgi:hypothetical protein
MDREFKFILAYWGRFSNHWDDVILGVLMGIAFNGIFITYAETTFRSIYEIGKWG